MLFVLPVISTGSMKAGEVRDVELYFTDTVDICKDDYEFTFLVKIGEVAKEDNFVGFELSFKYDTTKLNILPIPLYTGTISGRLQYDPNYFNVVKFPSQEKNHTSFRAECMHTKGPVAGPDGNPYLVAFRGYYIGGDTCGIVDDIEWEYIYFPEYQGKESFQGDEFELIDYQFEVNGSIEEENKFDISTTVTSVELDSANKTSCGVTLQKKGKSNLVLMTIENRNSGTFKIRNIAAKADTNFKIINIEQIMGSMSSKTEVTAEINNSVDFYECFDIDFDLTNKRTDSTEFTVSVVSLDDCECVIGDTTESLKIKNKISDPSGIEDNEKFYFDYGDYIAIKSNSGVDRIRVIDMKGNIPFACDSDHKEILINKSKFLSGVYVIQMIYKNGRIENGKLIINN